MIDIMKKIIRHFIVKAEMGNWMSYSWKKGFRQFGENSEIGYPGKITYPNHIDIGDNCLILSNCRIENFKYIDNSPEIILGNHCVIGYYFTILNASKVILGDDVLIASHVLITSENHSMNPESNESYISQPLISKPVIIGDGCWIGEKSCILPGVTIGKKSIIGAGSVVTKSIPDYCIAVGNPAKVVKKYSFETHKWETVLQ